MLHGARRHQNKQSWLPPIADPALRCRDPSARGGRNARPWRLTAGGPRHHFHDHFDGQGVLRGGCGQYSGPGVDDARATAKRAEVVAAGRGRGTDFDSGNNAGMRASARAWLVRRTMQLIKLNVHRQTPPDVFVFRDERGRGGKEMFQQKATVEAAAGAGDDAWRDKKRQKQTVCDACQMGRAHEGIADEGGVWLLWLCGSCASDYARNLSWSVTPSLSPDLARPLSTSACVANTSLRHPTPESLGERGGMEGSVGGAANASLLHRTTIVIGAPRNATSCEGARIGGAGEGQGRDRAGRPLVLYRRCYACVKFAVFGSPLDRRPVPAQCPCVCVRRVCVCV